MSVIYKSLKKLRTPAEHGALTDVATNSHRVIAFRTSGTLVALLVLVCLLGVVAGGWYIWDRNNQLEQRPVENAQAALRSVGAAYLPAQAAQQSVSTESGALTARTAFLPANQAGSESDRKADYSDGRATALGEPSEQTGQPIQSTHLDRFAPQNLKNSPLMSDTTPSSAASNWPSSPQHQNMALAGANPPMPEKVRLEALEKSRRIGQLVRQMDGAIAAGNDRQTEAIMQELVSLKGAESPYVLKLRAYWHVHKHEYSSASRLLKKVLAADPSDLEANVNMAVVEINTGRLAQAENRLLTLKEQFPENAQISELLQQLR